MAGGEKDTHRLKKAEFLKDFPHLYLVEVELSELTEHNWVKISQHQSYLRLIFTLSDSSELDSLLCENFILRTPS